MTSREAVPVVESTSTITTSRLCEGGAGRAPAVASSTARRRCREKVSSETEGGSIVAMCASTWAACSSVRRRTRRRSIWCIGSVSSPRRRYSKVSGMISTARCASSTWLQAWL
ncbi:hypothetical protein [Brachybacterium sp. GPGPB12]|uniref:hypothetical protein n=1 Tax=Brachybacterium sp. GPGPB12 TaxID=3023517 RepID=UPI0031344D6B